MSVKINNLQKFWLDAGYRVTECEVFEDRGVVFEVDVKFKRIDEQPVDFYNEWDDIKQLANRQAFYVMPIADVIDRTPPNIARVVVFHRDSVTKAMPIWRDISNEMSNSYWNVQRDTEFTHLFKKRKHLYTLLRGIQAEVGGMYTNTPSRNLLEGGTTYLKWDNYKNELNDFIESVQASEKVSDEMRKKLKELTAFYDLSML